MKTAVLPSGEAIHFPDETPDAHIHAAVRTKLNLPPPEGEAAAVERQLQQLSTTLASLQQQMAQDRAFMQQQLVNVAKGAENAVRLHANSERTGQLLEHAIAVMTAPKKAVKQPDGSWTTVPA
jgi:hypothetical protein